MTESTVRMARPERARVGNGGLQWYGILVPPTAMLVHLSLAYALVPWSCAGHSEWALHTTAIVLTLIAASGGFVGLGQWLRGGGGKQDAGAGDDRRDEETRARFMGAIGIACGILFSVAILVQWLATAFLSPCANA
jgi:hypothetical protein